MMLCAPPSSSARNSAKNKDVSGRLSPSDRMLLESSVKSHISRHFAGVEVPEGIDLHSQRYIDLCISTDMCTAADMAYAAIANSGMFPENDPEASISDDIRMVIGILRSIRRSCVPQELSAGILLMHLEIVEGIKF